MAHTEHLSALFQLEQESFSHPWSVQGLGAEIENPQSIFLVAQTAQGLCGYGSLRLVMEEASINNIAVSKAFRRQGVGRSLLRALMEKAVQRGVTVFFLEVRASNTAAIALYEGEGFLRQGVRRSFYRDPIEDGFILSRSCMTGE